MDYFIAFGLVPIIDLRRLIVAALLFISNQNFKLIIEFHLPCLPQFQQYLFNPFSFHAFQNSY